MIKPLSYSEMNLYLRNKQEYVDRYINGEKFEPTPDMELGTIIHKTMENPEYPWIQEMKEKGFPKSKIFTVRKLLDKALPKRNPYPEQVLRTETKSGVPLLAILDGFNKSDRILSEYKSSDRDYAWTQSRVDNDRQLSFYANVYKLIFHAYFREVELMFLHTGKGTVQVFKTARGPKDIKDISDLIEDVVYEMKREGLWELRKPSNYNPNQLKLL